MQTPLPQSNSIAWAFLRIDSSSHGILDAAAKLSRPDQERASRFKRTEDRARFIAGRGLLAGLLGRTGVTQSLPLLLALTEQGRPFLPGRLDLAFSISHAGEIVAVALACGAKVGLDVESPDRKIDLTALAGRIFDPADLARFLALPRLERRKAFFRAWTGKEAILKGRGVGLFGGLESISIPFDDLPATVNADHESWSWRPLPFPTAYIGCVVCDQPGRDLAEYTFDLNQLFSE